MGSPKAPSPPPVPLPPPVPPQLSSTQVANAGQQYQTSQAASRGFGATMLTGGQGTGPASSTGGKTLTGS